MKKLFFFFAIAFAFVLGTSPVMAAKPNNSCKTIQSGELQSSYGPVLTTGYDQWGYNYQANMFNGKYCDSYHNAAWCQPYKDIDLMMKWNNAWLSNQSCDYDLLLDRHFGFDSYIGSGAWLTNHQSGSYEPGIVDEINIGDTISEDGHNLSGWSNTWDWGGNYGGGDDGTLRLLMGPGDGCGEGYESAYFTMDTKGSMADKVTLKHLDGSQDDNFNVYLWNGVDYEFIGNYVSQGDGENWVTTDFSFLPRSGELQFKLVATGVVTGWCSNWGQVAFSWAGLEGIYHWNYFVKIVAVPADAHLDIDKGIYYTASGDEIGPWIWNEFAVVQEVSNDVYADQHGLQYKGVRPSLGNW